LSALGVLMVFLMVPYSTLTLLILGIFLLLLNNLCLRVTVCSIPKLFR
jgi:hypothetical protein